MIWLMPITKKGYDRSYMILKRKDVVTIIHEMDYVL